LEISIENCVGLKTGFDDRNNSDIITLDKFRKSVQRYKNIYSLPIIYAIIRYGDYCCFKNVISKSPPEPVSETSTSILIHGHKHSLIYLVPLIE
jgi:hypothetical protein